MLYEFCKDIAVGPLIRGVYRFRVEGAEHIPARGPAIFASNHLAFTDSIFLPLALPRRITFPAKQEYFTGKGVKGALQRAFFTSMGQIPIDRSGGAASEAAMLAGLKVLRRGEFFGIYPEGTRSPDGRLYKGKTGLIRLALAADCLIYPVAMIGTQHVQPNGQAMPKVVPVTVRFGEPFDFRSRRAEADDRDALRAMTDQVMVQLQSLSGQEYVPDVYAADVKRRLAEEAAAADREAGADAAGAEAGRPGYATDDMVDPAP